MKENRPFDRTRDIWRMNSRLQRIVVQALKDSRARANEMQILRALVNAILRPDSEGHRASLLEALGQMTDISFINANIAKEGIEIACTGSLELGRDVESFLLLTPHPTTTRH